MIKPSRHIVFLVILAVNLMVVYSCGGSPQPTPVFLPLSDLNSSYINQRITTEGSLWPTDSLSCQTIVWIEDGKPEERCTGFKFGSGFSDSWIDLALKQRGKSGLIIKWGVNNQQFNLYDDIMVYDKLGEDRLSTGDILQVTGTLYWPEGSTRSSWSKPSNWLSDMNL